MVAAFNNARRGEEQQLGLPAGALGNLSLPSQAEWNAFSDDQKALYLINAERTAWAGMKPGVIGLPLAGIEPNLDRIAQQYADYLVANNAKGHTADGRTPDKRIDDDATVATCHEFLSRVENIAYFFTGQSTNPLVIEQSVYNWLYRDASSKWGHREAVLLQDADLAKRDPRNGFKNNVGSLAHEGFLGIGVAGSSTYNPYGYSWSRQGTAVVMMIFDPVSTGSCPWDAFCIVVQPGAQEGLDTYLKEDKPDERRGDDRELRVSTEANKRSRALLQFDLSPLPPLLAPESATLSLWVRGAAGGPVGISAHTIEGPWNEAQAAWDYRDRSAGAIWAARGGDFSPVAAYTAQVGVQTNVRAGWDLTRQVMGWLARPDRNDGVILQGAGAASSERVFASSDEPNADLRPRLEVCYRQMPRPQCRTVKSDPDVTRDAFIREERPSESAGRKSDLQVSSEAGRSSRSLVQFDIIGFQRSLPASVVIESARMSLWLEDAPREPTAVSAHKVLQGWDEESVTWKHRAEKTATLWSAPGGAYFGLPAATAMVGATKDTWVSWNVKGLVESWLIQGGNEGLLLKADAGSAQGGMKFVSSDDGKAERRPRLEICFWETDTPPGPDSVTVIHPSWTLRLRFLPLLPTGQDAQK